MKIINEKKLMEVLDFIKTYQQKESRSPSYRVIMHSLNFSSLSIVQRYVMILKDRNLIEQNEQGNILTPINLATGKTISAPLVGSVACGIPILAEENIEQTFQLPTSIFGNEKVMVLHASGDSMINAGIKNGDLIVATICNDANDGDIIVALINDSATVKRLYKKDGYAILHPENPKYKDIVTKDLQIQGIVKHVIHSF